MRYVISLLFTLVFCSFNVMAVDEPPHSVLIQDGKFEIRQYDSMILAEVEVTGDMRRAGNSGFRPLADFIFGNNTSRDEIDMTAPVTRRKSEKIEMTAPVTRVETEDDGWIVAFVMPDDWSMDSLPRPNNPNVSLREVPESLMATVRFSGRGGEKAHKARQARLEEWIKQQGYVVDGSARYAGYDAPWVPWPLRRNEVMIPVRLID